MNISLNEIAELVRGELDGPGDKMMVAVAPLDAAGPDHITYLKDGKLAGKLAQTRAGAALLPKAERGKLEFSGAKVWVDNPEWAFTQVFRIHARSTARKVRKGIHPNAMVDPAARVGRDACILQGAIVEAGAEIGDFAVIHPGAYVGPDAKIGRLSVLHPGVKILERCEIGERCIIHAGAVIGSDGYGYVQVEGRHEKIPQIGVVVLENDVEVGANTTIDRATHGETRIGEGTKIDNLAQIAHNVRIGRSCLIVSQVGIAGSSTVGDGAILAGQAGIPDHCSIGKGAVVLAQAGTLRDVADGEIVFGSPARPVKEMMRINASLAKLPDMVSMMRKLKKTAEAAG